MSASCRNVRLERVALAILTSQFAAPESIIETGGIDVEQIEDDYCAGFQPLSIIVGLHLWLNLGFGRSQQLNHEDQTVTRRFRVGFLPVT
jgi:hypothetical protein